MKVSVIIPVYNSYKYMKKGLESLENQTFKDFEVIFVDDCSTDDTNKNLSEFLKKTKLNFKIILNEKNLGAGESRNRGIKKAKGKYICFMDSDDWYEINYIKEMLFCIENSELNIVMCNYQKVYSNGTIQKMNKTLKFRNLINIDKKEFLVNSTNSFCCLIIEKKLFEDIKISKYRNGEDMVSIPILIAKGSKFGAIESNLYNYYYRENSVSNNIQKGVNEEIFRGYEEMCESISNDYKIEKEAIGIEIVLYSGVYTMLKNKYSNEEIKQFIKRFEEKNPNWIKNKYINELEKLKILFLKLVQKKNIKWLKFLYIIRNFLIKLKVI